MPADRPHPAAEPDLPFPSEARCVKCGDMLMQRGDGQFECRNLYCARFLVPVEVRHA